jgi:UDP-GlcNAc:undecaprenyl-phosphate GlcNAc-1-phosphate transferase
MLYAIAFTSTMLISFLLTGLARKISFKYGIVTKPRKRDIHKEPIPRLGGIAIALSFTLVALVTFLSLKSLNFSQGVWLGFDKHFVGIVVGGLIISLTMLLDDLFGLKAWQKLLFQLFAVIFVIGAGIGINTLPNPFGEAINLNSLYIPILTYHGITYHFSLWSDLLTLVWMVGMMNVINFVDGVDGLAAGLSTIAAFTIFILALTMGQSALALISVILAGATIGFLFWNFPPAKIFMGDAGSMFLGFMLGVLPLISGGKLATAFLVLGFPIVDGLIVAGSRLYRGQNPLTSPDKTHLHHRFIDAGFSQRQAILVIYIIAIAFAWVALRSTTAEKLLAAVLLIILLVSLILYLRYRANKLAKS